MTSAWTEVENLRGEAQAAASNAWDSFRVDFYAQPQAPRLAAAVEAVAEIYERRMSEKGTLGYDVQVRGGPSLLDGSTRRIDHLDKYVVLSVDSPIELGLYVYTLDYQTLTLSYYGPVQ